MTNIKNVSQRLINNEAYIKTETSKVSEAGKNQVKDTFENAKSSETQNGKKELSFDEARLAATVDYNNVGKPASGMIDGESQYKNPPPTDKNPYGPGVGKRQDPLAELKQKVADDKQKAREGVSEPTGPNIGSTIDQFVSGEVKVETEGSKKAEEDRKNLKEGASGNMLLASGEEQKNNSPTYGKGMISQSGGIGYGAGYGDEGVKKGSDKAAKENPGLNKAVQQNYVNGPVGSAREYALLSSKDGFNPNDYERGDGTRVQTGKDGTVVETSKDGTKTVTKPDGSSTTVNPDGTYVDKDKDGKTTDKGGVKMPDMDHQYVLPEGFQQVKVEGVVHRNGSGDGGNIDPDSNADPKGPVFDDAQVHLHEMGKYGMVGQPDQSFRTGGGTGSAGTGQQGGDIDMGETSPSQGYTGATRTEDPADVNFNVGGQALLGVDSKQEEKKAKDDEEKKNVIKNGMFRRIQA
jgi:hypothetical protein